MKKNFHSLFIRLLGYWFIGLLVYLIIPPQAVRATGEFQADYDVQYAVSPNGTTMVTQNVALTNKLTNLYPKQYSILIDTEKINSIIAYDERGAISPTVTQKDGKTEILLTFNHQVVGLGKKLSFSLRFANDDIAKRVGSIWEVNIPGIVSDPDLGTYTVRMQVPDTFGPAAYMTPLPADGSSWTKEQMVSGGISAAYGESQYFGLDLSYNLQNASVTPRIAEIALPPDTAFQESRIASLDPTPIQVLRDTDGNWLARYELKANQSLDIKATVFVMIRMKKRGSYEKESLRPQDYLTSTQHWDTKDPAIISLASELNSPQDIYDYVVRTLTYDYTRVVQTPLRKGASQALQSPNNSLCMEFTDLFVAIARAAGIPAREAVGYAYTTNAKLRPLSLVADVLHAWPEYYDSEQGIWVGVDPTWADTTGGVNYFDKLDFNHIVFAIHGVRSDYPFPAGFYRKSGKTTKDVNVRFITESEYEAGAQAGTFDVTIDFPNIVTSGIAANGNVLVKNMSAMSIPQALIEISTIPNYFSLARSEQRIPPFGSVTIPVSIKTRSYLVMGKGIMRVSVNGRETIHSFTFQPMYWIALPAGVAMSVVSILVWYIFVKAKPWKRRLT